MTLKEIASFAIDEVMSSAEDESVFAGIKSEFGKQHVRKTRPSELKSKSLEEHDERFHPDGYKEGDTCELREKKAKLDKADSDVLGKSLSDRMSVDVCDITKESVDAIVNAANRWMLGGGGVDGAIHRAAGPQLVEECRTYEPDEHGFRVQTGEAKITKGYNLPAKHVIHTAGPDCRDPEMSDEKEQDRALAGSYRNSLELAKENGLKTVAFPSISTGIFGFPLERAAKIAAKEIKGFLAENPEMSVKMCVFDPFDSNKIKTAYEKAFSDEVDSQDAMDAQPNQPMTDLQKHDAKYHGGHYDGQSECKFREGMARGDSSDKISEESSSSKASRLHPIAPPPPQSEVIPDFTQVDLDDLKDARSRLETAARCLNGRVGNLSALQSSSRFPALDALPDDTDFYQRLDDLSKNKNAKVAAAASELKQIADNIASSKKRGWNLTAGMVDAASTFEGKLPSVQDIPPPPKSEAEKRSRYVKMARSLLESDGKDVPREAANNLVKANDDLTDFEENIAPFDEALSKESDPSVKKDLLELKDTIDEAYFKADKEFRDAVDEINKWRMQQMPMPEGATIKDVIKGFQDRGEHVPDALYGLDKYVTQKKNDDAWDLLKSHFGFDDSQRATCEANAKKNMFAFTQKQTIIHWSHTCVKDLLRRGRVTMSPGYDSLFTNNAGHKIKRDRNDYTIGDEGALFCRAMKDTDGKQFNWWDSSLWGVILVPEKSVMMVGPGLYNGTSRWTGRAGHQLSLAGDFQLCNALPQELKEEFFTKDLTGLSANDMHSAMFSGFDNGSGRNEIYPLGGITWETGRAIKYGGNNPPSLKELSLQDRATIKSHGWKVYYDGNKELVL